MVKMPRDHIRLKIGDLETGETAWVEAHALQINWDDDCFLLPHYGIERQYDIVHTVRITRNPENRFSVLAPSQLKFTPSALCLADGVFAVEELGFYELDKRSQEMRFV